MSPRLGPGVLFFGDAFHEGWNAYVNGQRLPLLCADVAFNAVELPSGSATVEWWFEPAAFRLGLMVSLVGLLLLAPIAGVLNPLLGPPSRYVLCLLHRAAKPTEREESERKT